MTTSGILAGESRESEATAGRGNPRHVFRLGGRSAGLDRVEYRSHGSSAIRRSRLRCTRRGTRIGPRLPRDRPAGIAPACSFSSRISRCPRTALALHRPLGRGGPPLLHRLHRDRCTAGLAVVSDALSTANSVHLGTVPGGELDLGADRRVDPVRAVLPAVRVARDPGHCQGQPPRWCCRRGGSGRHPRRMRPDPPRRGLRRGRHDH